MSQRCIDCKHYHKYNGFNACYGVKYRILPCEIITCVKNNQFNDCPNFKRKETK